jgi:hypothetical protein
MRINLVENGENLCSFEAEAPPRPSSVVETDTTRYVLGETSQQCWKIHRVFRYDPLPQRYQNLLSHVDVEVVSWEVLSARNLPNNSGKR